jgi:hypothetical protein
LSSKVDRRKFLKYIGAGLVVATAAGAGYYFYGKPGRPPSEAITIPKGWETASTYLTSSLARTTTTLPKGEWWKNAKVLAANVDYWNPVGKRYVEDARIEAIDYELGNLVVLTPAWGYQEYDRVTLGDLHYRGVMTRAYEAPFLTSYGDYVFANGEIYPSSGNIGEKVRYPLRAFYQSDYWYRYFAEKWTNPDGSVMADPIEGGAARNLKYEILDDPTWNVTVMSIHNPHYLDYVKKCLQIDIDAGFDGLSLDFMNAPAFAWWLGGDFSPWAEHHFKQYLSKSYSEAQLSAMEVRNLDKFSLRKYVLDKGYVNNVTIDDPIIKSWSKFEYTAFDEFVRAICEYARVYSRSKGKDWFPISGNIYNLRAGNPFTIMATNHFDIIWVEECEHITPPYRTSLLVRQGWALSRSYKPVWQHVCFNNPQVARCIELDYANLLGIVCAQAYSAGGVYLARRFYDVGSSPGYSTCTIGPRSYKLITSYCRFVRENKAYFLDARPCGSAVAIAYSLPTMMMGSFYPLGVNRSWEWDQGTMGVSHVLDREHIPFDFIVLGHPQFWDDSEALAGLPDYDILVLSNFEAMSDDQVAAVRGFVERGGSLLSFGATATRDENYSLRRTAALRDLTKPGLNVVRNGKTLHLSGNPGYSYWRNVVEERKEDPSNYKRIRDAVASLSRGPPIIDTNAPDNVSVSLLRQADRSIQVHVVNLDYDEEDDSIAEKDDLRIKVRIPSGFSIEGKKGKLMTPDGNGSPQHLEYTVLDGYLELEVPHLRIYSIAAIYDPKYFT